MLPFFQHFKLHDLLAVNAPAGAITQLQVPSLDGD
jgi:hypothetical protein